MFFRTDLRQADIDESVHQYINEEKCYEAFTRQKSVEDLLSLWQNLGVCDFFPPVLPNDVVNCDMTFCPEDFSVLVIIINQLFILHKYCSHRTDILFVSHDSYLVYHFFFFFMKRQQYTIQANQKINWTVGETITTWTTSQEYLYLWLTQMACWSEDVDKTMKSIFIWDQVSYLLFKLQYMDSIFVLTTTCMVLHLSVIFQCLFSRIHAETSKVVCHVIKS